MPPATFKLAYVFVYSVRYFCPILTKFGSSRQVFLEVLDIKIHENPPRGRRLIQGLDTKKWQHCCNLKDVRRVTLLSSVPDSRSSVEVVQ